MFESGIRTRADVEARGRRRCVCHPGGRDVDARGRSCGDGPCAARQGGAIGMSVAAVPDVRGRFGAFGGRYAPEVLIPALEELRDAWSALRDDPSFRAELGGLLADFVGRPTPITHAARLSEELGLRHLAQAGGPRAHRRAQDQQRARPGPRGAAARQGAHHRRDRRRPARRRHGHRLRAAGLALRRLHGRGGHPPPGAERRADAAAGRRGPARHRRHAAR